MREIQQEFEVNATVDMRQLNFEPKKLARNSDPSTSKRAANQAGELRGQHHCRIMDSMNRGYYAGMTAYDIALFTEMDPAAVFRRLNELEKAGKIYTTGERRGPTGRMCRVWRAI